MRNPILPLSPMSNDGSPQHKATLAPAGLERCSRPNAVGPARPDGSWKRTYAPPQFGSLLSVTRANLRVVFGLSDGSDSRHALAIRLQQVFLQEREPLPLSYRCVPASIGHVARAVLAPVTMNVAWAVQKDLRRADAHDHGCAWDRNGLVQARNPVHPKPPGRLEVDEEEAHTGLPRDVAHRQEHAVAVVTWQQVIPVDPHEACRTALVGHGRLARGIHR